MNVRDIMTPDPVSVGPDSTVAEAVALLHELTIRHLPVVSNGMLVGILSDRDLRAVTLPLVQDFDDPDGRQERRQRSIADIMQGEPISIGAEDSVDEAIDLLVEHKIGALPVVDAASDELVGIVSYIDILQAVRGSV